ncbi:MAG: cytochrome b/b6 domain-containing protein [Burkholderiales bacterium]|nr:cytochrome b/b6 domain-containing protein [Burkholderiales bacterium]
MNKTRILVWDLPVRVFHWLLALSFAGAFLTAESERVRDVHVALGYTFMGLVAFRLLWGAIGSRHARFASFAYGPKAVLAYLASLARRRPVHYAGHNPAGGWAIFAILALGIATAASGYAVYTDAGGRWMESLHEGAANALLALAILHVVAVVLSSVLHRENLVTAMITGFKAGDASEGIGRVRWAPAAVLAAAVVAIWSVAVGTPDAQSGPAAATGGTEAGRHHQSRHRGHGDDS